MKIKRAVIENFKGIRHVELDFCDPYSDEPRQLTAILGDNGSGKTSVLQSLWLALALFRKDTKPVVGTLWEGLIFDRISSFGETRIHITLFDEEAEKPQYRELDSELNFHDGRPFGTGSVPLGGLQELDRKLANTLYFTQNRNLGIYKAGEGFKNRSLEQDWSTGVAKLREQLGVWWLKHVSLKTNGGKDYIKELEESFSRIFPGTKMIGVDTKEGEWEASAGFNFYFLLERDGKQFDIAEMSSGEQAVFTILFEFVRNDIKQGIILIDEIELHLHPPEQQMLLNALPKIGPDCQFIITTHSPYIEGVIPDEHEIRLPGVRSCL